MYVPLSVAAEHRLNKNARFIVSDLIQLKNMAPYFFIRKISVKSPNECFSWRNKEFVTRYIKKLYNENIENLLIIITTDPSISMIFRLAYRKKNLLQMNIHLHLGRVQTILDRRGCKNENTS